MNTFDAIKKVLPQYTKEQYNQYLHWAKNGELLRNWLFTIYSPTSENETDAQALKRLGKLEMTIGLMHMVQETEKCIRHASTMPDIESIPQTEVPANV